MRWHHNVSHESAVSHRLCDERARPVNHNRFTPRTAQIPRRDCAQPERHGAGNKQHGRARPRARGADADDFRLGLYEQTEGELLFVGEGANAGPLRVAEDATGRSQSANRRSSACEITSAIKKSTTARRRLRMSTKLCCGRTALNLMKSICGRRTSVASSRRLNVSVGRFTPR